MPEDKGMGPVDIKVKQQEYFTDPEVIPSIVHGLRKSFQSGTTQSLEYRRSQLSNLLQLLNNHTKDLSEAVYQDLRRHQVYTGRIIGGCVQSTQLCIDKLEEWAASRQLGSIGQNKCEVRYIPRGTVLIIGTWNFPNSLVWKPLASAIAAGCTVLIKLSEVVEHSSRLMLQLIEKYLDNRTIRVVVGDLPLASAVLEERFDMIFYTGNTQVGKVVMQAAAKHLTPCVLELGGKNPVVVLEDANIVNAARKIVDGRFKNSGQFCVAPDYVLCDKKISKQLASEMVKALIDFYTENPQTCPSFGRIINQRHCQRLIRFLDDKHGGTVLVGGNYDIQDHYVAPTIILNPSLESLLLNEEIFGPLLPIVEVDSFDETISIVNSKPTPLALYVFSSEEEKANYVVNTLRSGGACVNDVIIHMLNEVLPFGGCSESGMGSYHGEYGFKAFSHEKGVLVVNSSCTGEGRYPPFA